MSQVARNQSCPPHMAIYYSRLCMIDWQKNGCYKCTLFNGKQLLHSGYKLPKKGLILEYFHERSECFQSFLSCPLEIEMETGPHKSNCVISQDFLHSIKYCNYLCPFLRVAKKMFSIDLNLKLGTSFLTSEKKVSTGVQCKNPFGPKKPTRQT